MNWEGGGGGRYLTAPPTDGAHYDGKCVDSITGREDTTDNSSASVQRIVK